MPKFAANISMMFNELDFLDRFAAAAAAGFEGIEFLFPYEYSSEEIKKRLDENNLTQALFNTFAGNWEDNERGFGSIPGREQAFEQAIEQAIEYANILGNTCIHAMSGLVTNEPIDKHHKTLVSNLKRAAPVAARYGKMLIIEPINSYRDRISVF